MSQSRNLSLDSSIIYRSSQKYFDRLLAKYDLGYGNILILTLINEREGISMNDLANLGNFDKGTITKSIQHLIDKGYVKAIVSLNDKRQKELYLTDEASNLMPEIYIVRQRWWEYLLKDLNDEELAVLQKGLPKIIKNAKDLTLDEKPHDLHFFGIQKLSLLDYPTKMATTLFTGGCNFKCPFCHNRDLVFLDENENEIPLDDIFSFLNERKNILDGVCISGGEPLLQKGLKDFIIQVKKLGLSIKVDTNGSQYEKLKELIDEGLIDYVAMDIKNSKDKYAMTIDVNGFDLSAVEKSVELLKESKVDYEFRTTIVKEFHTLDDMQKIGEWLKGAKRYFLQSYVDSENVIKKGLHAHDKATLEQFRELLTNYIEHVELRGIE